MSDLLMNLETAVATLKVVAAMEFMGPLQLSADGVQAQYAGYTWTLRQKTTTWLLYRDAGLVCIATFKPDVLLERLRRLAAGHHDDPPDKDVVTVQSLLANVDNHATALKASETRLQNVLTAMKQLGSVLSYALSNGSHSMEAKWGANKLEVLFHPTKHCLVVLNATILLRGVTPDLAALFVTGYCVALR